MLGLCTLTSPCHNRLSISAHPAHAQRMLCAHQPQRTSDSMLCSSPQQGCKSDNIMLWRQETADSASSISPVATASQLQRSSSLPTLLCAASDVAAAEPQQQPIWQFQQPQQHQYAQAQQQPVWHVQQPQQSTYYDCNTDEPEEDPNTVVHMLLEQVLQLTADKQQLSQENKQLTVLVKQMSETLHQQQQQLRLLLQLQQQQMLRSGGISILPLPQPQLQPQLQQPSLGSAARSLQLQQKRLELELQLQQQQQQLQLEQQRLDMQLQQRVRQYAHKQAPERRSNNSTPCAASLPRGRPFVMPPAAPAPMAPAAPPQPAAESVAAAAAAASRQPAQQAHQQPEEEISVALPSLSVPIRKIAAHQPQPQQQQQEEVELSVSQQQRARVAEWLQHRGWQEWQEKVPLESLDSANSSSLMLALEECMLKP